MTLIRQHSLDGSIEVPVNKRTTEWLCAVTAFYASLSSPNENFVTEIEQLYKIYDGHFDKTRFEYITKQYGKEYPADLKNIPLITPLLKILVADYLERPLDFVVASVDQESIKTKIDKSKEVVLEKLMLNVQSSITEIKKKVESGQDPNSAFNEGKLVLTNAKMQDLFNQAQADVRLNVERAATNILKYLMETNRFRELTKRLFEDYLVSKSLVAYIYAEPKAHDPIISRIHPANIITEKYGDTPYIEDRDWIVVKYDMTYSQVVSKFGHLMTEEEKAHLRSRSFSRGAFADDRWIGEVGNNTVVADSYAALEYATNGGKVRSSVSPNAPIIVHHVQFKVNTAMTLSKSKIKKKVNKLITKLYQGDYSREAKENEELHLEKRFYQVLYSCWRINEDIFIYESSDGTARWQPRDPQNYSRVKLHYYGILKQEKSLVELTVDLQDKYNLLHYHYEMLVAISGNKGIMYPVNLLPDGMTLPDAAYMMKAVGMAPIDTSKDEEGKINQFTSFDMTLSNSIGLINNAISQIELTAERVVGIPRQRMGEIGNGELVGNTQAAISQSMKATEYIMFEVDSAVERIVTALLNAAGHAYSGSGDKAISYISSDRESHYFKITEDFGMSRFGVFVSNGGKERVKLQSLAGYVPELIKAGLVGVDTIMSVLDAVNYSELKQRVDYQIEKTKETAAKNNQAQLEAQKAAEDKKAAIEERKLALDEKLGMAKIEVEKEALALEEKKITKDQELAEREISLNFTTTQQQLATNHTQKIKQNLDGKTSAADKPNIS